MWMVLGGLEIQEALDATHHPCSQKTLYRRVAKARSQMQDSAREELKWSVMFLTRANAQLKQTNEGLEAMLFAARTQIGDSTSNTGVGTAVNDANTANGAPNKGEREQEQGNDGRGACQREEDITVPPGRLGIQFALVEGAGGGARITGGAPSSLLHGKARVGDVIVAVGGTRVRAAEDLTAGQDRPRTITIVRGDGSVEL